MTLALQTLLACALGLALAAPAQAGIVTTPWGEMPDGRKVNLFTLTNAAGMEVKITNYGGRVVSLDVPDRNGHLADVVLGYDNLKDYLADTGGVFGAIIGRYANRIAGARFTLDGHTYDLAAPKGAPFQIHGGAEGWYRKVWGAKATGGADPKLTLTLISPDGDMGFPGTMRVTVVYTLTRNNTLRIDYAATTDKPTVANLTNHSYFNLKGAGEGDVLGTELQIFADRFTVDGPLTIPTGAFRAVRGTPLDFTRMKPIGADMNMNDPQIAIGHGYDHNFVIDGTPGTLRIAARALEPQSGRVMEVWTTQPGVQLYTDNSAKQVAGKGGKIYIDHGAFCLETQHYPNSPNQPNFPPATVTSDTPFHEVTEFRFSTDKETHT